METNPVRAWQSATPVKYVVITAEYSLQFTLQQFDKESVELYFGASFVPAMDGATPPVAVPGVFRLDLDSTPELTETALIVEWSDATARNRLIVPRASVSGREGLTLVRNEPTALGVTLNALDQGGILGYLLTNAAVGT